MTVSSEEPDDQATSPNVHHGGARNSSVTTNRHAHVEFRRWTEVLLTPMVVAIMGAFGAAWIAREQTRSASELQNRLQAAQSETARVLQTQQLESTKSIARETQQAKLLEIFAEQIVSPDERARANAVRLLHALDSDLGKKLADGIAEERTQPTVVRREARIVAFAGATVRAKIGFTSVKGSCANAPRAFFTGSHGFTPEDADAKCVETATTSSPRQDAGAWVWHAELGNVPIQCECRAKQ